jgi:AcrR family transcriptional regulator
MAGLRERKKLKTRAAIHDAAMRLFAERGYNATTVADIAEAADVSRATFFSYYASKDDVVLGDAPLAIETLTALLADLPQGVSVLAAVRGFLRTLTGWLGDERLPLQWRLAREIPSVAARRLQMFGQFEDVIAAALAREIEAEEPELVARLVAASLIGALATAEKAAADRTTKTGRALSDHDVDRLLDATMAFIDGGLQRVKAPAPEAVQAEPEQG